MGPGLLAGMAVKGQSAQGKGGMAAGRGAKPLDLVMTSLITRGLSESLAMFYQVGRVLHQLIFFQRKNKTQKKTC